MKALFALLVFAYSVAAATVYTTTTGSLTNVATWGGSLPEIGDTAIITNFCTLNGSVTFGSLTVDTANTGMLTVSGTSVINADVITTHYAGSNSIHLATSANLTINGTVTIGNNYAGAGPWRGFTSDGNNVVLTINGNVVKTGSGYGIRFSHPGSVTINGGVDSQNYSAFIYMAPSTMSACTITGSVTNSTPDGGSYGYVIQTLNGTATVNGDVFITGIGWGVRGEGGNVVINGNVHTTWTPGWTGGADSVDNAGAGTYTVNGNVHHQDSDVAIYARNGSGLVTVNGNVYYTNQNRAVGVGFARGSVQALTNSSVCIRGHVISPDVAGMTNVFRVAGGTCAILGDLISPIAVVDGGGTLNTYGLVSSGNLTNSGTWNHIGYPAVLGSPGTRNQILEQAPFVNH